MSRTCALRECPTLAGKWTLCDEHADRLGTHTLAPHERNYKGGRKLTRQDHRAISDSVKQNGVKRTSAGTGISRVAIERILDSTPGMNLTASTTRKLDAWHTNGNYVPSVAPRPSRSTAILEQHHLDTMHIMVEMYGSRSAAALVLGLSKNAVAQWLKRPAGTPIMPHIPHTIEQWAATHIRAHAA